MPQFGNTVTTEIFHRKIVRILLQKWSEFSYKNRHIFLQKALNFLPKINKIFSRKASNFPAKINYFNYKNGKIFL